ncbi:MAG: hypothetical protein WCF03_20270 [Nitrososphaeraceae archaeon]
MMLNHVVMITIKNIESNPFDNTHIHLVPTTPTTSIALMLLAGSCQSPSLRIISNHHKI